MHVALIYGRKVSLFIFTVTLSNTRCAALFLDCLYYYRR